jgi:hypothetical protein
MPKSKTVLFAKPNPALNKPDFTTIDAICEAFGVRVPHRGYLRPSSVLISNRYLQLWWPNEANEKYENKISGDGKTVTSRSRKSPCPIGAIENEERAGIRTAIFFKPKKGAYGYRFVGVFQPDPEASWQQNRHVHVRVEDQIELP